MAAAAAAATLFVVACVSARALSAQQRDTLVVPMVAVAPERGVELPELDEPTTPGGAFLRAILLPGWGHASIGAYSRGGFYFATESTTGIFLTRTLRRLGQAKDIQEMRESRLEEQLIAQGVPAGSDSLVALVDADLGVNRARRLVASRKDQLEDWIALGAFLVFLAGADAFVSAHLMDFPAPLDAPFTVDAGLSPVPGATAELRFKVPLGR